MLNTAVVNVPFVLARTQRSTVPLTATRCAVAVQGVAMSVKASRLAHTPSTPFVLSELSSMSYSTVPDAAEKCWRKPTAPAVDCALPSRPVSSVALVCVVLATSRSAHSHP